MLSFLDDFVGKCVYVVTVLLKFLTLFGTCVNPVDVVKRLAESKRVKIRNHHKHLLLFWTVIGAGDSMLHRSMVASGRMRLKA